MIFRKDRYIGSRVTVAGSHWGPGCPDRTGTLLGYAPNGDAIVEFDPYPGGHGKPTTLPRKVVDLDEPASRPRRRFPIVLAVCGVIGVACVALWASDTSPPARTARAMEHGLLWPQGTAKDETCNRFYRDPDPMVDRVAKSLTDPPLPEAPAVADPDRDTIRQHLDAWCQRGEWP